MNDLNGNKYIETVPKLGYRFVAPVKEVKPEGRAALWRWAIAAGTVLLALAAYLFWQRESNLQAAKARGTPSPEAYQLYLRGRVQYWDQQTPEGKAPSPPSRRLWKKTPTYARAWAGLADCYTVGVFKDFAIPLQEAIPKARAAARRAVELDDGLAEAHTALAIVKFRYDWDWPGAEREYQRALELDLRQRQEPPRDFGAPGSLPGIRYSRFRSEAD